MVGAGVLVLVITTLLLGAAGEEEGGTCTVQQEAASVAALEEQISELSSRLHNLETAVAAAADKWRKLGEKKLKMDIHYLEAVLGCWHQCFHAQAKEEQRRRSPQLQRVEELETMDSCLHGCMHLHPYLS